MSGPDTLEASEMIYTFVADDSTRAVVEANSLARFFTPVQPEAKPPTTSTLERAALLTALATVQQWIANQPTGPAATPLDHR